MTNSTTNGAGSKASKLQKPRPDFPLFPHATGRWAKKVRGRFCFFGKVADDPKGEKALETWREQKDDLLAGRTPRVKAEGFTLRELLDRFVVSKRHRLDTHEISAKHFAEMYATCRRIGDAFGLAGHAGAARSGSRWRPLPAGCLTFPQGASYNRSRTVRFGSSACVRG